MLLALSVISHQSRRLGGSSFKIFDEQGGTIGRGRHNDWILEDPDSLLSSRHAVFRSLDGRFLLEDASTNGTGLNRRDLLVPRGQSVPLSDGDRLFLGDFEILVQFIEPVAPGATARRSDAGTAGEIAQFERVLHVVTQGLIEVLGDRAAIKRMFRLKFTETAYEALLNEGEPHVPRPLDAFRAAFADLLHHQLAMLTGIEAAYSALLSRFDPQQVEAECDVASVKRGVLGRLARHDHWDYYRQSFAQTFGESGTAYQQIFGESFARAYEAEIERLEKARIDRPS